MKHMFTKILALFYNMCYTANYLHDLQTHEFDNKQVDPVKKGEKGRGLTILRSQPYFMIDFTGVRT